MAKIQIAVYEHKQGPSLSESGKFIAYPWVNGECLWLRAFGETEAEAKEKCLRFVRGELERQSTRRSANSERRLASSAESADGKQLSGSSDAFDDDAPEPTSEGGRGKSILGSIWINDGSSRKRIPKNEADSYLERGWKLGKSF